MTPRNLAGYRCRDCNAGGVRLWFNTFHKPFKDAKLRCLACLLVVENEQECYGARADKPKTYVEEGTHSIGAHNPALPVPGSEEDYYGFGASNYVFQWWVALPLTLFSPFKLS